MRDLKCPYCGVKQNVCHADYTEYKEGVRHACKCTECKKTFVFEIEICVDYTSDKADCLNGAKHTPVFIKSWPERFSKIECKDCHLSRSATPEEFAAEKSLGEI